MKRSNSKRSSKQKPWENQGYNRGRGSCGAGVPIGTASQGCGKTRHEVRRESRVGSVAAQAKVSEEERLRAGWVALMEQLVSREPGARRSETLRGGGGGGSEGEADDW